MITVSTTDKRDGEALALFARCVEWQTGHTKGPLVLRDPVSPHLRMTAFW